MYWFSYWQFKKFQLPSNTVRKLLSVIPPSESNLIRVDFRSTHVHYINDLEVDAMYKRWRSNLQEVHYVIFLRVLFLEGNSWSILVYWSCIEHNLSMWWFRSWCQFSLDNYDTSVKTYFMQFMFWIQPPFLG